MQGLKKNIKLKGNITLKNFINLTPKEAEMVRAWRNNVNIKKWMYKSHVISVKEHADFVRKLRKNSDKFCWLIKYKKEDIGVIGLNRVDFCNKNAFLGIYRNPHIEMPGCGRLLGKAMFELIFNIAGLHTLKLEVIENNKKALNFYKSLGFREEGRLSGFVYRDRKWKDVIIMGILNKKP